MTAKGSAGQVAPAGQPACARLTDEQLWERASLGDKGSEEELFARYKESVRGRARLYFMPGAEREDVVQEGMIGLFNAIRTYDPSRGASFSTYAGLCINSRILTAVRDNSGNRQQPLNSARSLDEAQETGDGETSTLGERLPAGPSSDPEEAALSRELEGLIGPDSGIFSRLEKRVLALLMEGRGYRDIAEELGKSPKQIDNAIQRIRGKIRKVL
ncbi:MAG: sigma-70 family RNA polymerase sigma factor [Firmicutes bacterium]|nr:sigma-70 family RNA polymerase sigma factor [Bacillota bacterium]MBQ2059629.1 sigma-70 family RNA polymerase sigma factor [Bacillota bacterium]